MIVRNVEKEIKFILIGVLLVGCYIVLNRTYTEGVNACIEKGYNVNYCEYHASK